MQNSMKASASILKTDEKNNNICRYFGICGACSLRDKAYQDQLTHKKNNLITLFADSSLPDAKEIDITASPDIDYYRNKMEFTFGVWDDSLALGLHERNRYYHIIDLEECYMQSKYTMTVVDITRKWANANNIDAYHKKRRTGILRHLVIKDTKHNEGLMVHLIAAKQIDVTKLVEELKLKAPLKSFYFSINKGFSDVAAAEETTHVYGDKLLTEKIADKTLSVGINSFFQVNPRQVANLYKKSKEWIGKGEMLIDLYCGVGGFGIFLADNFEKVIGIELNDDAIRLAEYNSKQNKIKNIEFISGDSHKILSEISLVQDVKILVDPPRCGMDKGAIKRILDFMPETIIYVSCNPKSLVRDLAIFKEAYEIERICAFDMFPHTEHVEVMVKLAGRG
ncbi:MAG: 23S rRNA (uracil(1939)-C(5))-methyltransferase RlmD [Elusimicrobiota bacterium]